MTKYLQDGAVVTLKTGEKVDSEQTLASLKHSNNITKDITKDELCKVMKESGYELIEITDLKLLFTRPEGYKNSSAVLPNKYFIGEKDGYLAVYKSDEKGNLSISNEKDVYRSSKKVSDLPEIDQQKIKNFEFIYDSRENAIEDITEFIS